MIAEEGMKKRMDEEDFINDLGWNGMCSGRTGESTDSKDKETVRESGPQAIASTSQEVVDSSYQIDAPGNVTAELSEPDTTVKPKKKVGRPPKGTYSNIKPTRESQRVKRSPKLMTYERRYTRGERNKWNQEDLKTLLEALQKFGPNNINAIKATLPHISRIDVKNQIQMWNDFAHTNMLNKMAPDKNGLGSALKNSCAKLDEWIEHFKWLASTSSTKSFALANVFSLISEYGKMPPPEKCNGLDFRAMYRYLHCVLNGEPYYDVNPRTALEIRDNISHMLSMIQDCNYVTNLQHHLFSLTHPPRTRRRNYSRQPCMKLTAELKPEVIINQPHLNPLRIPPHTLAKLDVDQIYYDEEDIINFQHSLEMEEDLSN